MKMASTNVILKVLVLILTIYVHPFTVLCADVEVDDISKILPKDNVVETESDKVPNIKLFSDDESSMESLIKMFELSSGYAAEELKNKSKPKEDTKQIYIGLVGLLDNVIQKVKTQNDTKDFLKYEGFIRVVAPNLLAPYAPLREKILQLITELSRHNLTAIAASSGGISRDIVNKLVRIFEKDKLMDHKTAVIKIFYMWLPENPKMQLQVLKNNGLDLFYGQLDELDFPGVYTLLSLANKILKEHIKALSKEKPDEDDDEKLELYRKMDLANKLSSIKSCNGMYNFFEVTWERFSSNNNIIFSDYLGLMTYFKKVCLRVFTYRTKAKVLFEDMIRYLSENEGIKNAKNLINILADMLGYLRGITKEEL